MSLLSAAAAERPGLLDRLISVPSRGPRHSVSCLSSSRGTAGCPASEHLAQERINEIEATNQSGSPIEWWLLAGYVCVVGMVYEFLVRFLSSQLLF